MMYKNRIVIFIFSILSLFSVFTKPIFAADSSLLLRKDVNQFIQMMVQKHQFNRTDLEHWFSQVSIQPKILEAIAKPAEKLPWYKYEPIFMSEKRIQEGVQFWNAHIQTLKRAEKEYGIPPEIIVAIIGVESFYGKHQGPYPVFDALVTLGFDYPPRSKFFLSELEEFLLLAREQDWDLSEIKGSYAGAMGNPQFIASSYRRYAVDYSGQGKRDLIHSAQDSIGSVANYFKLQGWRPHAPVVFPATVKGNKYKDFLASKTNPKPNHSLPQLQKAGIAVNSKQKNQCANCSFALIALETKEGPQYWLGAQNFYAITRYNHSDQYAMAVYNLAQRIKEARKTV